MGTSRHRWAQLKRFLLSRFSPQDVLGLHLTLGLLVLIVATWLFGAIAEDVVNREPLTVIDAKVSNQLQAHANKPLTSALLLITNLHSTISVTVITIVIFAYFVRRRLTYWALAFGLSMGGGILLNILLKNAFHRTRPQFDEPILTLTSYGFPSGHTMMATTLYGFLCIFVFWRVHSWFWRVSAILVAILLIFLVGFSRIYLGAHYLSDVLAAMVEGLAWLALCLTAVYTMRRWKEQRRTTDN